MHYVISNYRAVSVFVCRRSILSKISHKQGKKNDSRLFLYAFLITTKPALITEILRVAGRRKTKTFVYGWPFHTHHHFITKVYDHDNDKENLFLFAFENRGLLSLCRIMAVSCKKTNPFTLLGLCRTAAMALSFHRVA